MNLKTIVTKESYQIEATPLGGFIARPNDPALETIQGQTREDVERQIDAKIESTVEHALPTGFGKFGITSHRTTSRFSYRVEEKPGGGFIARPSDSTMGAIEGVSREEVQKLVQAKMSTLLGQQIPDLFANASNVDVAVNKKVTFQVVRSGSIASVGSEGNSNSQSGSPALRVQFALPAPGRIVGFLIGLALLAVFIYFRYHH